MLLLSNISFGQRIEWEVIQSSDVTYSDDTKLTFASGNGIISGTYELLSDGKTLTYEVTINPHISGDIYEVGVSAQLDEYTTEPEWWYYLLRPYTLGTHTFSGSVYLDYEEPKPFVMSVDYLHLEPNGEAAGFHTFGNYYPE